MLLEKVVKLGEILEIKLEEGLTRTKLLETLDDGEFVVFQPTFKGLLVWSDLDQVLSFTFYRPDGIYTFDAQIKETYIKEELRLCRFKQITPVKKHQRRNAYRLPIVLKTLIECVDDEQTEEVSGVYKGKTINISEKSVQLTCFDSLEEDTLVSATIYYNDYSSIMLRAKVFRCSEPKEPKDPYEIVLLFVDCSERDIMNLRRYILRQQIYAKVNKRN